VPSAQATDVTAAAQAIDTAAAAPPASNTQDTEMQSTNLDQPVAFITVNGGLLSTSTATPEHPPATEAMTMDPQQPLAMQPPRANAQTVSSSTSAGQSRHTAETPPSRRTNWGKLKEQARKDRSKGREVLIAVNPNACFCFPRDSNEVKFTRQQRLKDMTLTALTRRREIMMPTTTAKEIMIQLISQRES
jgi:hypothetical protein